VIAFFTGGEEGKQAGNKEEKYCRACKAAKKNTDCENCIGPTYYA